MTSTDPATPQRPGDVPPQLGHVRAHFAAAATSNGHLLELLAAGLARDDAQQRSPASGTQERTA